MNDLDRWNARAGWCLTHASELQARAEARLKRWKRLERDLPERELLAAAHQGLMDGEAKRLVATHDQGCLVLAGGVGEGKTTAACWKAYEETGPVLWLDASSVALSRPDALTALLADIPKASLVVLDDVGTPGTVGEYQSPKIALALVAIVARRKPSIVTMNLDRSAFAEVLDGGSDGRLLDRFTMRPNRFVEITTSSKSRRATADPPPTGLPPQEQTAQRFLWLLDRCRAAEQAKALVDVDTKAVLNVGMLLGTKGVEALDAAVAAHDAHRLEAQAAIDRLLGRDQERFEIDGPEEGIVLAEGREAAE